MAAGPRVTNVELRPLGEAASLVTTPSGAVFEVAAPLTAIRDLLERCDGTRGEAELVHDAPDPAAYRELLTYLRETGCLTTGDTAPPRPATVIAVGDEALVGLAAEHTPLTPTAPADLDATLAANPGCVVVALRDRLDVPFLEWLNDLCAAGGVRWAQFHLDQGRGWAGPAVQPGSAPDYRDLLGRRRTAAELPDVEEALMAPPAYGRPYLPPAAELRWMVSAFMLDLARWLGDGEGEGDALMPWAELELNPVTLEAIRHPLLPLPDRPLRDPGPPLDQEALVDARTGLITGLPVFPHHESIPRDLVTVQSNVADMRRLYTWANNIVCGGSRFGDPEGARLSAIGEAVERYCGNCVTDKVDVREASYEELKGEYALDPERLVLYSDRLYDSPGFPFVRFERDLPTHWVRGRSLTAGRDVWVPASMVYVNWYMDDYAQVPPTNYLYYPGIAAGPSLEWAITSGIEEIIERDITMIWWMNAHPLPAVRPGSELDALWAGRPAEMGQRAWLIHLDNEFGVPVMAGVLENRDEGLLNVGFAARPDPVEAARKAWTEALTLQDGSRDLDDPDGLTFTAIAEGWVSAPLKPWRADQAYLDSYDPGFRDVNDLMCQQQVFLDPRAAEIVRPWLDTPATRDVDDLPRLPDRSLDTYRKLVESRGYEIVYVELTTQDVAKAGLRVVRVLIPGLVPNFPAAFPFLGRRRIQDEPVRLGWRERPLAEEELNHFPLPHA
ncbi:YcaO-like family protein [Nonomuraea sp. NPDC050394]|uniref:YcaO-like family protein n=1 Tax=Nonomuraea sp. NPDC050394 TaxID=3364363 RepID=UPI0037BA1B20